MSLGAETLAALPFFKAQAVSRFTETFTFYKSGPAVVNPDTLVSAPSETVIHAAVAGRVKYPTSTVSESTAVGQRFAEQDVQVHVAVGAAPLVCADHFCRVTASVVDPGLVGRVYRVKGSPQAGQVTAHRFPVEEVS